MKDFEDRPVEVRLRAAVESSPSGLLMIDSEGRMVLVNRQVETLFGYSREELLGRPVEMLVPERFREKHPAYRGGFVADPRTRSMGAGRDLFGLRKDGTEIPVEIGLNPVVTNEGLFIISSIVDIRARKRAEDRFRAAVESSPNGMIMTDAGGRIVLVNRETERLFGYEREKLLGQPIELLVPERFRRGHPGFRYSFYNDPRARSMGAGRELFGLRSDGTEIPVEIGLTPIETDEGLFVLSSVVDISARREAEHALRESEERFRLLVDGVRDYAIIMLDTEGRVQSWNEGAERIIGYGAEEILGSPVSRLYPGDEPHRAESHLQLARQTGSHEDESWRIRKDGSRFLANVVLTTLRDSANRLKGFAEIIRDITEQRRLEEQLRQSQKMEAVGTLAGGIAHDFNNILAAIMGYGELIRDEAILAPELAEDLTELLNASHRGKALVERILAFSRREEPARRPLNLATVVEEGTRLLRATLPTTIEIHHEIDPRLPRVLADGTAVQQVLMNLSTNAAHAMPDGGRIDIAVHSLYVRDSMARSHPDLHEGPYTVIQVKDSGTGMDATTAKRAFEPFFTTKEPGKGTGLGLAMVHTVMREHDGAIILESEIGVGTTVRCLFPVIESDLPEPVTVELRTPRGSGQRILYLDDEGSLARLGAKRLNALGYAGFAESSPARALEQIRSNPSGFELVITDFTMPKLTGLEFAREVHRVRKDLPVLMITGYIEEMSSAALEAAGIRATLRKPVTIEDLAAAVARVFHPPAQPV